jgi:hypothetical protein
VDKTPNYYRLLPFIDRVLDGQALYVFLVRHPFDNLDSLQRAPAFLIDPPEDPDIARAVRRYGRERTGWAQYWLEVNERLEAFAAANPSRCRVFRYEDVVEETERTLEVMLQFIGEGDPGDLIARAFTQPHTYGYGDWKIPDTRGIHRASVGKWRSWPAAERDMLWSIVGDLAQSFSYTPALDGGSGEGFQVAREAGTE